MNTHLPQDIDMRDKSSNLIPKNGVDRRYGNCAADEPQKFKKVLRAELTECKPLRGCPHDTLAHVKEGAVS